MEINMHTKASFTNVKSSIGIAAMAVCVMLSASVQAADRTITVRISVSTAGLDLAPAGARELYRRLKSAAEIACSDGNMVGLEPVASLHECTEKALGDAVGSAHLRQLSSVYLATHSADDAAKYGIEVPVRVATE